MGAFQILDDQRTFKHQLNSAIFSEIKENRHIRTNSMMAMIMDNTTEE